MPVRQPLTDTYVKLLWCQKIHYTVSCVYTV